MFSSSHRIPAWRKLSAQKHVFKSVCKKGGWMRYLPSRYSPPWSNISMLGKIASISQSVKMVSKLVHTQKIWKSFAAAACMLILPNMANADWKAGAASVDITPDFPVRLSGYGSRTSEHKGVTLPLHAKALAVTWEKDPVNVILTVDNCGVPATMRQAVLEEVNKAGWKLADERFALHSSHTHCAPALPGVLPFLFSTELTELEKGNIERYGKLLVAKMTEVVVSALEKQTEAKLDWNEGKVRFAMNRRLKTPTGYANSPNVYGVVDHALPVLRVTAPDGSLRAVFTSYACHCTTLALDTMHPDWAGCAQKEVEQRFPGAVALTAIGCGADQNPYPRRDIAFAERHGADLAQEVVRLVQTSMKPVSGPVSVANKSVELPYDKLPDLNEWKKKAEDKNKWNAQHGRHFLGMLERGESIPTSLPYTVQVWNFSKDLLFINLPGEVVVDYSLRFKREYDINRTWVNGYTNDVPCYIPSQRVWEEGGYEAAGAMTYYGRPTRFASGIEDIIAKAVSNLVPAEFRAPSGAAAQK